MCVCTVCACSSWEGGGVKGFGAGPSNSSSQRSLQTSLFGRSSIRTFLLLMSVSMYTLCRYLRKINDLLIYLLFPSGKLRTDLKLWSEPPGPALIYHQTPTPDRFFTHPLMVWIPSRLWKVTVFCPDCGKQLTGSGVHKRSRKVLDIDRYHLMVSETLKCTVCSTQHLWTSQTVRNQLDLPHQQLFRLILTQR